MSNLSDLRITVLGDGGAGNKTACIIQYVSSHFVEEYDPTIEDSYKKATIIDQEPVTLTILDTAGQEEFTALRSQWIIDSDIVMIGFSLISRSSFEQVANFFDQVVRERGVPINEIVWLLTGNKSDLVDKREVPRKEAEILAMMLGCHYMETSAKTRYNIDESFEYIVREYRKSKRKPKYFLEKRNELRNITLVIGIGWFDMFSSLFSCQFKVFETPNINKNLKNVWLLILSYVFFEDDDEIINCRLVCKYWNDLVLNNFPKAKVPRGHEKSRALSLNTKEGRIIGSDWGNTIYFDYIVNSVVFLDVSQILENFKSGYQTLTILEHVMDFQTKTPNLIFVLFNFSKLKVGIENGSLSVPHCPSSDWETNKTALLKKFGSFKVVIVDNVYSEENIQTIFKETGIPNPMFKGLSKKKEDDTYSKPPDFISLCQNPKKKGNVYYVLTYDRNERS